MKDVMIDFETFGNGKNACIVQVGACLFDRKTGAIGRTLKENIDAEDPDNGELDGSTVYFWLKQDDAARNSLLTHDRSKVRAAMNRLNAFVMNAECIWSHSTFDFVIFMETLRRLSIVPAFSYRTARDIRTLIDLANINTKGIAREGTHRDALDDCIFQVKYCVMAFNKLAGA